MLRTSQWAAVSAVVAALAACGGGGDTETVVVEVHGSGEAAVAQATGLVWALQASHDWPATSLRVVVRGKDSQAVTATAAQLVAGGLGDVRAER